VSHDPYAPPQARLPADEASPTLRYRLRFFVVGTLSVPALILAICLATGVQIPSFLVEPVFIAMLLVAGVAGALSSGATSRSWPRATLAMAPIVTFAILLAIMYLMHRLFGI
jgi:cation transport ATPase